jgi:hypothetical protein
VNELVLASKKLSSQNSSGNTAKINQLTSKRIDKDA